MNAPVKHVAPLAAFAKQQAKYTHRCIQCGELLDGSDYRVTSTGDRVLEPFHCREWAEEIKGDDE